MKRICSVNGYTIYGATSARDEANYNCHVGSYNIYLSSDIRDYGLSYSYPEYEDIDSLSVAKAMCDASKYAVASDLAEEISGSTAQDMDLVLEIERLLESGLSIEEVRDRFDEDLRELDELGERLAAVKADAQTVPADPELTYAQFIELAKANYCKGGDVVVECWDEAAFDERVRMFGPMTEKAALDLFGLYRSAEADVTCWADPIPAEEPEEQPAQTVPTDVQPEQVIPTDMPHDEIGLMMFELEGIHEGDYVIEPGNEYIYRVVRADWSGTYPSFEVEDPCGKRSHIGALHANRTTSVTASSNLKLRRLAAQLWAKRAPKPFDLPVEDYETQNLDRGGAEAVHVEYTDGSDGFEQPRFKVYYEGEVFFEDHYKRGSVGISRTYHDGDKASALYDYCEAHNIPVWLYDQHYGVTLHDGEWN